VHSSEVHFIYDFPLFFQHLHFRAKQQGTVKFYLFGDLIHTRIVEPSPVETLLDSIKNRRWEKLEFPAKGNTMVDRIVFSQGLDIDMVVMMMEEEAPTVPLMVDAIN
jgi:hypothetical protein